MKPPPKPARIRMWVARDSGGYYIAPRRPSTWMDYKGETNFDLCFHDRITQKVAVVALGHRLELGQCEPVDLEVIRG